MRNKLIDEYGAYRQMSFMGPKGKWSLIETRSTCSGPDSVMKSIDTFKDEKGKLESMTRKEVDKLFEDGKIWV